METSVRSRFTRKPRVLIGTSAGTIAFYLFFLHHYVNEQDDDDAVRVWFGMRGDGRCGRDFVSEWMGETTCGKGHCCSSHGWCGHGEEYCSVAMGCQSNCWKGTADTDTKDARSPTNMPDDDEYMDRMHHYRYDEDEDSYRHYHNRRYNQHYRNNMDDDHPHDYHHRYDDDYHPHHQYGDDYPNAADDEPLPEGAEEVHGAGDGKEHGEHDQPPEDPVYSHYDRLADDEGGE